MPKILYTSNTHETVEMSEEFKYKIGNTPCMASGNHNTREDLAVLVFEIDKIEDVKKIII